MYGAWYGITAGQWWGWGGDGPVEPPPSLGIGSWLLRARRRGRR